MNDKVINDYDKKIVLKCRRGQWTVEKVDIVAGAIPLTVVDVSRISRIIRLEQRRRIRDMNLTKALAAHEAVIKKDVANV